MTKNIAVVILSIIAAALVYFINLNYPHHYLLKILYSLIALIVFHLIIKVIIQSAISNHIKDKQTRYSVNRMLSIVYLFLLVITIVGVWVENIQSVLVAYGLVGAGVAVALKDLFVNFVGGIVIFLTNTYRVGDRIEIGDTAGDIIDVGIMYTTLMEIKNWVDGDQATGRLITIPNGKILSREVHNYNHDHNFIWDEMHIPITYDSNWRKAYDTIVKIVTKETKDIVEKSKNQVEKLQSKYFLEVRPTEPAVYIKMTDNWISFYIRYVTHVRERRGTNSRLHEKLLEELLKHKDIKIASTTIEIVD